MTRIDTTTPTTDAGRRLAVKMNAIGAAPYSGVSSPDIEDDILAIEAEARLSATPPDTDPSGHEHKFEYVGSLPGKTCIVCGQSSDTDPSGLDVEAALTHGDEVALLRANAHVPKASTFIDDEGAGHAVTVCAANHPGIGPVAWPCETSRWVALYDELREAVVQTAINTVLEAT